MPEWKVPMPRENPAAGMSHFVIAVKCPTHRVEYTGQLDATLADMLFGQAAKASMGVGARLDAAPAADSAPIDEGRAGAGPAAGGVRTLEELEALWDAQADEYNQWGALGLDERVEFAQKIAREDCARQLDLKPAELRLMAGEMSAQEMRTVQAVLGGLRHRMGYTTSQARRPVTD